MADRCKKSGVADIEILDWVGDVGDVVLADYFFGRFGVFREAWKLVGLGREVGG